MQKIKNITHSPLTYKIFVDVFLLLMIVTVAFVIIETFIPGILSAYISPFTLFTAVFIVTLVISFLAHKINANISIKPHKKITTISIPILFAILIGIAGYSYGFLLDALVVIFSVAIFILLHHLVSDLFK